MAPPPELVPDIVGEILLLLPPDNPASLVRASLVCKPWHRLISGPSFRRRYRLFHGAPPLLGFLHDHYPHGAVAAPRFVPAAVSPSPIPQPPAALAGYRDWSVIDCRHGRVLFDIFGGGIGVVSLVVWDPITGVRHSLPRPPIRCLLYGAAVLCAGTVQGRQCDHLDCHGNPFLVVLMALDYATSTMMQVHTYSSETGAWKFSAHHHLRQHVARKPSTLIGDCIYFRLDSASTAILRYDMGKNRLSTIDAPASHVFESGFAVVPMADGSLGFADIRGSQLCIWSKNVGKEVSAGWEQCGVIELEMLIPEACKQACVVGSVEGAYVVFVNNDVGVFPVGLKSGRVMGKISEPGHYDAVFPFTSFYTQRLSSRKWPSPVEADS